VPLALGADGKWDGLWARYREGRANPSSQRVARVDKTLKGTARIYYHPLWDLLEKRSWTLAELRKPIARMDPRFALLFVAGEYAHEQPFWVNTDGLMSVLAKAEKLVTDSTISLDAIAAIAAVVRYSELSGLAVPYMRAMLAWSECEPWMRRNGILNLISPDIFSTVFDEFVEPLRHLRFAHKVVDRDWIKYKEEICRRNNEILQQKKFGPEDIELIDALRRYDPGWFVPPSGNKEE
jgi:hypothetical protein